MSTVTTPIHTQFRTIDGLSIRFAESAPHEQQALLLCPWPEFWVMGPGRDLVRLYPLSLDRITSRFSADPDGCQPDLRH